jgi:hypothetical protein
MRGTALTNLALALRLATGLGCGVARHAVFSE